MAIKLCALKPQARPDEPVRTGIATPDRLNAVRTGKSFFCRAARKKRLQCPPVPVRTGIARSGAQKSLFI